MVEELEEFGERVELVGEMSQRDAIIPSPAWLSRFCSSNNSFGLLIRQSEALHYRSYLPTSQFIPSKNSPERSQGPTLRWQSNNAIF
eukprot:8709445-Pyramimonas_sp.AAC.1